MEYREIMDLLRQGKKLVCNQNYLFKDIPMIRIEFADGTIVRSSLNPVAKGTFGECSISSNMYGNHGIKSISVNGYSSSTSIKVKYIYANKQMNTLYAMLEDNHEVLYPLSILDTWTVTGEYKEPELELALNISEMTVSQLIDALKDAGYEVALKKKED